MSQIGIVVFGFAAIWLSQSVDPKVRRFAPISGLMAQPFWFYSTYVAEQWGIFTISIFYAYAWFRGLRNQWWNK